MIVPRLTTASSLPFSGGSYRGHANVSFTLKGTSTPNMSRAVVVVQSRSPAGGSWHTLYQRTVGTSGAYSISMKHASPGSTVLRWFYKGSPTQRWMSSGSPLGSFTSASAALGAYSHSIVAGGLDEMSNATRFTPSISLMMRLEMRSSRS